MPWHLERPEQENSQVLEKTRIFFSLKCVKIEDFSVDVPMATVAAFKESKKHESVFLQNVEKKAKLYTKEKRTLFETPWTHQ